MKIIILSLLLGLLCSSLETTNDLPSTTPYIAVSASDSLELLEFYDSTGGEDWTIPWDTMEAVCDWHGVTLNETTGYVTKLELDSNNLQGNLIDFNLPYLTKFLCDSNQLIGPIPNFNNIPNLVHFQCSYNQLSDTIPNFTNLPNLAHFNCRDNQLTGSIPDFDSLASLLQFRCQHNLLDSLIPNFTNLPNLTHFFCSHNDLIDTIPNFDNMPNLIQFYCNHNSLTGSIPSFDSIPNLAQFYCNNNELTGPVPDFSNFIALTDFNCRNNKLTFSDLIPTYENNIAALNTFFLFSPQDSIILDSQEISVDESYPLIIDLGIDDAVTSNTYTWYKDGVIDTIILGNNKLIIPYALLEDSGTYRCQITNSIVPVLTLRTNDIVVHVDTVYDYPLSNTDSFGYHIITNELIIDLASNPDNDCSFMNSEVINYLRDTFKINNPTLDICNCDCLLKVIFNADSLIANFLGIHVIKEGMQSALDVDISYEYAPSDDGIGNSSDSDPYFTDSIAGQGEYTTVYIIDTGLDISKVEGLFTNSEEPEGCSDNYDDEILSYISPTLVRLDGGDSPFDDHPSRHGTKMYEIIANVAQGAGRFGIAKVISESASGTKFDWACAVHHAVNHNEEIENQMEAASSDIIKQDKIRIINSSLGWSEKAGGDTIFRKAIIAADSADIIIVASAGNDNMDLENSSDIFPACSEQANVITVAAVNRNGGMPDFSNYGESYVDIAAPGVNIGTDGDNGTSPAAAFVSGHLAYIIAENLDSTNKSIIEILYRDYTKELPELENEVRSGRILWGFVEDYYEEESTSIELVPNPSNELEMTIHPNPTTGNANVTISNTNAKQVQISINSLHGMTIYKNSVDVIGNKIEGLDFGDFPKGMYILTLNDGKNIISKRILIK